VEIGRKHRTQDRFHCGCDLRIAADQPDPLAAADLPTRTGHGRLQQSEPARRHAPAERGDPVGIAGAGAEHDLAGPLAQCRQQLAFDDSLDLIGTEYGQHDGIAAPRQIGDRPCWTAPEFRELGALRRVHIEADDLEALSTQAMRQRLAQ
jgi:hypothetical protein